MIFKSPTNITYRDPFKKSVFLAGSIDMGSAKDWQEDIGLFFMKKDIMCLTLEEKIGILVGNKIIAILIFINK